MRTLSANGDIMIRTLCLVFAFTWFTARGARAGDVTIAANAVLLHFFEVAAYLIDGFAYASEALVGQSVGAKNRARFRQRHQAHNPLGPCCGSHLQRHHLVRRALVHRSHDGQPRGARNRPALSVLGRADAVARHHLLSVRRHLHRRHGDARHAQHDGAVTA